MDRVQLTRLQHPVPVHRTFGSVLSAIQPNGKRKVSSNRLPEPDEWRHPRHRTLYHALGQLVALLQVFSDEGQRLLLLQHHTQQQSLTAGTRTRTRQVEAALPSWPASASPRSPASWRTRPPWGSSWSGFPWRHTTLFPGLGHKQNKTKTPPKIKLLATRSDVKLAPLAATRRALPVSFSK